MQRLTIAGSRARDGRPGLVIAIPLQLSNTRFRRIDGTRVHLIAAIDEDIADYTAILHVEGKLAAA